ncbi:MAG: S-adenosylmethionine:tRNA ribosyltransferase-isomerase, partial [Alphaproteobacteria bacterium]|nr:S-adenosylmethionine:tRNA ribosyltransferase-isomerase [Alphaproteobacteria bacterium]
MRVDLFDFDLNPDLIAKQPAKPRDHSRLLDLSDGCHIVDRHFYDLPDILQQGDVLVFNDTKVIPARLHAKRGDALLEITLYHPEDGLSWHSFIKNAKRLKAGDTLTFYTADISCDESTFQAEVLQKNGQDGVLIKFLCQADELSALLQKYGSMPLPPYIKRDRPQKGLWSPYNDKEDYQTVYAKVEGAVAAPTAGLHFTQDVLNKLDKKGVERVFLTLHVGAGTFLPVKTDDTKDHKMHAEFGVISEETAHLI